MISVSFSDILKMPEFKGYNEVQLLHPSMDKKVLPYLYVAGLDYKRGYQVVAFKHRNLQQKVVVGYLWSGEVRSDDDYRNSSMCSAIDRVIMSSKKDFSLTKELSTLMGGGLAYGKFADTEEDTKEEDYLSVSLYEDDYREVEQNLIQLRDIALQVRGSPYNSWGSLKTVEEYLEELA